MEMEELVSISGFLLISKCTNEMKFYNCPPVLWEIKRRYVSQWDKKEGKDLWNEIVDVLIRTGRTCPSQNEVCQYFNEYRYFILRNFFFIVLTSRQLMGTEKKRYRFCILYFFYSIYFLYLYSWRMIIL